MMVVVFDWVVLDGDRVKVVESVVWVEDDVASVEEDWAALAVVIAAADNADVAADVDVSVTKVVVDDGSDETIVEE